MEPRVGSGWLVGASVIQALFAVGFVAMPSIVLLSGHAGSISGLLVLFIAIGAALGTGAFFLQRRKRWAWGVSLAVAIAWLAFWLLADGLALSAGKPLVGNVQFRYLIGGGLLFCLFSGRAALDRTSDQRRDTVTQS
jgi:hypothetical protein